MSAGAEVRLVLELILVAVAVALGVDNRRETRIGYIIGRPKLRTPLALIVVVAAILGRLLLHRPRSRT